MADAGVDVNTKVTGSAESEETVKIFLAVA